MLEVPFIDPSVDDNRKAVHSNSAHLNLLIVRQLLICQCSGHIGQPKHTHVQFGYNYQLTIHYT